MADSTANDSFWDKVGDAFVKGVGGYFDLSVAKTQAQANAAAKAAEDQRASTIDQLTRALSVPANSAQAALQSLPGWVVPAAVLGFGGILALKFLKK